MNTQKTNLAIKDIEPEQDCVLPPHPFFQASKDQASFVDCIDAIDHANAVIALCDFLKLDDDHGGLSSDAAFGYYWITVLTRGTLSYVSDRLMILDRQKREKHKQESAYLSALVKSLHSLGRENRERFLNNAAGQMNIKRSALDKFVRKRAKQ